MEDKLERLALIQHRACDNEQYYNDRASVSVDPATRAFYVSLAIENAEDAECLGRIYDCLAQLAM